MAYPPALPPSNRVDSTLAAGNHASDHNALVVALRAILDELGANPSGGYADLTSLINDVATNTAIVAAQQAAEAAQADAEAAAATATAPTDSMVASLVPATSSSATSAALGTRIKAAADPHLVDLIPRPVILAHRGGLAVYPEESMEAFRAAAAGGYILELDLRPLADGTLVACHDATVTRTMTGITGNVADNSLTTWQAARVKPAIGGGRAGTPATWHQILAEFGGRAVMCVEFKETTTDAQIRAVYDELEAHNLKRSVIMQAGGLGTSSTEALARGFEFMIVPSDTSLDPVALKAMGINYIAPGGAAVTQTYVAACAAAGLIVTPYTFNTSTDLAQKLGWGGHGLITDDPWGVTRYYPPKTVEKFDSGYAWPNGDGYNVSPTLQYLDVAGGFMIGDGNNGAFYRRLGQFSKGAMVGRFQFDLQFQAYGLNQTRFAGIFIGHKASDLTFADSINADDTLPTTQGYHFLIRRNGSKEIFNVDGTTKANIATHASAVDSFGPVGAAGPVLTFEIVIDATNVTMKCLNDNTQVTVAHSLHRYTDAFLSIGNNGTQVRFKEIRVAR